MTNNTIQGNKPWFKDITYADAFAAQEPRPESDWDDYFMDVAERTSRMSHCVGTKEGRLTKNGAVIARNHKILATGYNGSPPGSSLCQSEQYCPRRREGMGSGQRREFCPSIHAEVNAILNATVDLCGSTMYLFAPLGICKDCAAHIVAKGITRVVKMRAPEYDALTGVFFRQAAVKIDYMSDEYHEKWGMVPYYPEKHSDTTQTKTYPVVLPTGHPRASKPSKTTKKSKAQWVAEVKELIEEMETSGITNDEDKVDKLLYPPKPYTHMPPLFSPNMHSSIICSAGRCGLHNYGRVPSLASLEKE